MSCTDFRLEHLPKTCFKCGHNDFLLTLLCYCPAQCGCGLYPIKCSNCNTINMPKCKCIPAYYIRNLIKNPPNAPVKRCTEFSCQKIIVPDLSIVCSEHLHKLELTNFT